MSWPITSEQINRAVETLRDAGLDVATQRRLDEWNNLRLQVLLQQAGGNQDKIRKILKGLHLDTLGRLGLVHQEQYNAD